MLPMLDGNEHAGCEPVGWRSNARAVPIAGAVPILGVWCNDSTAASNSASVGLIPTTPAIHGLRHTTIAAPDKSRLNILETVATAQVRRRLHEPRTRHGR